MSLFMYVGSAPTLPEQEFVPLLWGGPALRKARAGGVGGLYSPLWSTFLLNLSICEDRTAG